MPTIYLVPVKDPTAKLQRYHDQTSHVNAQTYFSSDLVSSLSVFKESRRFGGAKPGDRSFWPETGVLARNRRFGWSDRSGAKWLAWRVSAERNGAKRSEAEPTPARQAISRSAESGSQNDGWRPKRRSEDKTTGHPAERRQNAGISGDRHFAPGWSWRPGRRWSFWKFVSSLISCDS